MENWMTDEMKIEAQKIFEPLLGHPLTNKEIFEIIFNLRGFAHTLIKMDKEEKYGKQI